MPYPIHRHPLPSDLQPHRRQPLPFPPRSTRAAHVVARSGRNSLPPTSFCIPVVMAQSGNSDAAPISTQPAAEEVTVERMPDEEAARLRHLEFVQQAAAQAVVLAATAYAYAKQGAGPLLPGVDHVEGTVKAVVGPVYDRYHAMPLDLLKFLDRKEEAAAAGLWHLQGQHKFHLFFSLF
ncbi:REF/SRPP-like protein OsI_017815 isoform X2 [Triticum aestivum]|uniref:REF/SRPP-like protein OsI_017815 isoform X2 n=1 Tax=Triticum aestivum TaxID=4565 RepID=UPI001D021A82|nr:REF/SRPP-like protein OsI_017815 isoform X2 [Triticum aestivum]